MWQELRKDRSLGRSFLRRIGAAALIGCGLTAGIGLSSAAFAPPVAAQGFSAAYEFLEAVDERDGDTVTAMLNEPGTTIVNSRDITSGETGLHIVTKRRDSVWVRFLLGRGANPNIRDKNGVSPLQIAVGLGFIEGIEELLKRGAEVSVSDRSGETPLIAAVHRRDVAVVRLLLDKGANPDRADNSGRTARDYADLMNANTLMLEEFARADKERAEKTASGGNYGPS